MPSLSVIVPTRERADTLIHTLRTLTTQDYCDCEFLVSDNASADSTREVVSSFADSRIRYVNTGKRLSMSRNWEFALANVRGEYLTFIGDDDGFIPGAISRAMAVIREQGIKALVWDKADYHWPDHINETARNWFTIRTKTDTNFADGKKRLKKLMLFRGGYTRLPCVYNSIVATSALRNLQQSSTNGVFFNSISPDIFSGIALSTAVGPYIHSEVPFSVAGASRHSNGASSFRTPVKNPGEPARKFLAENDIEYDARILYIPTIPTIVMGEYLLAKRYFPALRLPEPDWKAYVRTLIRVAPHSPNCDDILASAAHTSEALHLGIRVPTGCTQLASVPTPTGMNGETFHFRAPERMVSNIFDACELIGGMLPENPRAVKAGHFSRAMRNIGACVVSEARNVYRAM